MNSCVVTYRLDIEEIRRAVDYHCLALFSSPAQRSGRWAAWVALMVGFLSLAFTYHDTSGRLGSAWLIGISCWWLFGMPRQTRKTLFRRVEKGPGVNQTVTCTISESVITYEVANSHGSTWQWSIITKIVQVDLGLLIFLPNNYSAWLPSKGFQSEDCLGSILEIARKNNVPCTQLPT